MQSGYSEGVALVEMEYKAGQIVIHELDNMLFMNNYICVEETLNSNDSPARFLA